MSRKYSLEPVRVSRIETKYRRIVTPTLPTPRVIKLIKELEKHEPRSMFGQVPIGIKRTYGINVEDLDGNVFLDATSGVLVTNIGHSHEAVAEAVKEQLKLFHFAYCFPYEKRLELVKKLIEITPENLDCVFLLTTGSEAVEAAIKNARRYGIETGGPEKRVIISFKGAFHGRTMGAQMAGGIEPLKSWIGYQDPGLIQVEFPNCYHCWKGRDEYSNCVDDCVDLVKAKFEELEGKVVGVLSETYQGRGAIFPPDGYYQKIAEICRENDALLILDEVQAGFGRTGKLFAFEHYNVSPNLLCIGKGVTSSLPLSALIGESQAMNYFEPGSMTSTHGANPVCVAAALASINEMLKDDMWIVRNAAETGKVLGDRLMKLKEKYEEVGNVSGRGMVYGIELVKDRETKEPHADLAFQTVLEAYHRGVLLFAPIGAGHNILKINPPLIMGREAAEELAYVIDEAIGAALEKISG
ncbi:aspartate aminotransferase family protein [Candidatus Bathyarchaeota archaeon]|nr:MAG: aspartate aminotransferase family protein [Candidatus Bathyarchaeota archaeon]